MEGITSAVIDQVNRMPALNRVRNASPPMTDTVTVVDQ